MRQRSAIALALSLNGQLVLADEPTSALDQPRAREILGILRQLPAAVFLITHQAGLGADFGDRVLLLHDKSLHDITILKHERRELFNNFNDYGDLLCEARWLEENKKDILDTGALGEEDPCVKVNRTNTKPRVSPSGTAMQKTVAPTPASPAPIASRHIVSHDQTGLMIKDNESCSRLPVHSHRRIS
jgi:ABC-type dipeptide/oligopeptide/nickel transport system ATPase component